MTEKQIHAQRQRIGARLRELREAAGMTQEALAAATGLAQQHIVRVEKGQYSTGQDILHKVAAALDIQLDFVACASITRYSSS